MRFRIINDAQDGNPVIIFDSPFLQVRNEFSFIKTADSTEYNGIRITVKIENTSAVQASVGLRMLIDTSLGEGRGNVPFFVGKQAITGETVIDGSSGENLWFSRSDEFSIMGNITVPENEFGRDPDYIHFANWKKLNDAPWKAVYNHGRNFHMPPYSIGDSAVCYYYEPDVLYPGESFFYQIFLAEESPYGFSRVQRPEAVKGIDSNRDSNIERLYILMELLDMYIDGKIEMSREELAFLEREVSGLKALYRLR
jgi:hypothetical protein